MRLKNLLILIVGLIGLTFSQTTVYITPSSINATTGQSFTLYLRVSNVTDLYAWQAYLSYDTFYVSFSDATPGGFLGSGTFFYVAMGDIIGGRQYFWPMESKLGAVPGSSGSGTLANITFTAKRAGTTQILLHDSGETILVNSNGNPIPYSFGNTICTVNIQMEIEENTLAAIAVSRGIKAIPNPFRDHILLGWQVKKDEVTAIKIYNATGRLVKQFNHLNNSPFNQVVWDGTDDSGCRLPTGVYFVMLENSALAPARVVKIR